MARCFKCNKKLKMAEELVGKCKCNNTFCSKHRISSQHSCTFDFKNDHHFVTERELQYSILRLLEAELALEKARQETAVKPPSSKKTQGKHYI